MSKESFYRLLSQIEPLAKQLMEQRSSSTGYDFKKCLPLHMQLLLVIRYFATGSFQQTIGDTQGACQASISRYIVLWTEAICLLKDKYIRFPTTEIEKNVKKGDFYRLLKKRFQNSSNFSQSSKPFPIGCIDCTHVKVLAAGEHDREKFRNRKGEITVNVQAVCDARLRFTNVVARWQGSLHDSRIFKSSKLCETLAKNYTCSYLLGDSGYALQPYLLTPFSTKGLLTHAQSNYNFSHIQTRNTIERAFGLLKKRFSCLNYLRLKQKTANQVIISCAILHNFLICENDFAECEDYQEENQMLNNEDRTYEGVSALSIPNSLLQRSDREVHYSAQQSRIYRDKVVEQYFQ